MEGLTGFEPVHTRLKRVMLHHLHHNPKGDQGWDSNLTTSQLSVE